MYYRLFVAFKAILVLLIGIFTLELVKIPVLSWGFGFEKVQTGASLSSGLDLKRELEIKNPFLPSQFVTQYKGLQNQPQKWALKGTLLFGKGAKVILEDKQTGAQFLFGEGEAVEGVQIIKIDRNYVQLKNESKTWELALDPSSGKQTEASVLFAAKPQLENLIFKEVIVRKKSLDQLVLQIPRLLNSLELILFEGSPGPKGYLIAVGKQLMQMDPMGFEDGDVIKKVNGIPIDSEKKLYEVFRQISSEQKIEVELDRNQQDMVITYHVES